MHTITSPYSPNATPTAVAGRLDLERHLVRLVTSKYYHKPNELGLSFSAS